MSTPTKLVPVEPTEEMLNAVCSGQAPWTDDTMTRVYKAMIDASPEAPKSTGGAINAELLQACKNAVGWLAGWASAEPYISRLTAAIEKAESSPPPTPEGWQDIATGFRPTWHHEASTGHSVLLLGSLRVGGVAYVDLRPTPCLFAAVPTYPTAEQRFTVEQADEARQWVEDHLPAEVRVLSSPSSGDGQKLREALEAAWQFAKRMRNASQLVGPYPDDPRKNRIWVKALYAEGRALEAILKPTRAALGDPL